MSDYSAYHRKNHCFFLIQYHVIWCPKFRYPVLCDGVDQYLKDLLVNICDHYGWNIKAMEIMPDHVHLFLDLLQTVSVDQAVRTLKSITAKYLFANVPHLRAFYSRCGVMWSKGYFAASIGNASAETVRQYIEGQKLHG